MKIFISILIICINLSKQIDNCLPNYPFMKSGGDLILSDNNFTK